MAYNYLYGIHGSNSCTNKKKNKLKIPVLKIFNVAESCNEKNVHMKFFKHKISSFSDL